MDASDVGTDLKEVLIPAERLQARVTELAAEIRQCETTIAKMIGSLDPDMTRAKSARHQHAANARWHRGAAS